MKKSNIVQVPLSLRLITIQCVPSYDLLCGERILPKPGPSQARLKQHQDQQRHSGKETHLQFRATVDTFANQTIRGRAFVDLETPSKSVQSLHEHLGKSLLRESLHATT